MKLRSGYDKKLTDYKRREYRRVFRYNMNDPQNQQNAPPPIPDFEKAFTKIIPNLCYDGNPYELNDFLFDYKLAADGMEWTEELMIKRLPLHLKGMAKQVFVTLTVDDRSTWDKLKAAMTKNILIEPSPRLHLNEFRQRSLRKGETPLQLAYALRAIAGGAFPNATRDQVNAFLLDQFFSRHPKILKIPSN